MIHYIPIFENILRNKGLPYSKSGYVLQLNRYFTKYPDLKLKIIFLLFPSTIDILIVLKKSLNPEQVFLSRPLIQEINDVLSHGVIESEFTNNYLRFTGNINVYFEGEEDEIIITQILEFICDYFIDLVPQMLANVYLQAIAAESGQLKKEALAMG